MVISSHSFFARAIEVDHAGHPALGYIIGSRTASGLKEEYRHLDGPSIRDLAKAGVPVKADPVERIEVAYTGDTRARDLSSGAPPLRGLRTSRRAAHAGSTNQT